MGYLGTLPYQSSGAYKVLDDISGSFNASDTSFALSVNGVAYSPVLPQQLLISVAGIIQEPGDAYTVAGGNIVFSAAPASGATFFGTVLGDSLSASSVSHAVTADGLTSSLTISDGGTGASTASAARTNLGLVIGTDVQAYDAQLADIAGLTPTDSYIIVGNGTNFVAETGATARASLGLTIGSDVQAYDAQLADIASLTPTDGNIIVGDGTNFVAESGATARTSLGLTIGTDVQAYDAQLADIAGLTPTDGYIIIGDGANFVTETGATARASLGLTIGTDVLAYDADLASVTAAGKALLDDADASAQRTTLGLGTSATLDVGTSANNIVQLDGSGLLPAVDGSQLTGISAGISMGKAIAASIVFGG